ncbi:MAG TPA: response regulator [Gemmatimonadaceae bacterium]|nr:response regulator [Gemmatimonadaceae bacterium]
MSAQGEAGEGVAESTVRKRIAVVEDNADNRLLLRSIIDDQYDITEFASGAEALVGMRKEPPDLVLLDISLPDIDGPALLRALRADPRLRSMRAIAVTAHAMAHDRERLLAEGFDDYVSKPIVDDAAFLATIDRWLHAQA